jgi:hypothetical protein
VALLAMGLELVLAVLLWIGHWGAVNPVGPTPWLVEYVLPWIPQVGIGIHLAVDGFSLLLILLTAALGVLAVTVSGGQASFYVNGADAGSGAWANPAVAGTRGPLALGAQLNAGAPEGFFNGSLDELNIFNRALALAEVNVRTLQARYNVNDRYLRPGEEFDYLSTVTNLLNSRFAYGLLDTLVAPRTVIVDCASKLLPIARTADSEIVPIKRFRIPCSFQLVWFTGPDTRLRIVA